MATESRRDTVQAALRVARLYYVQNMTTAAIAQDMGTSRATVSRLLSYAMKNGLVEIRINDPGAPSASIEGEIRARHGLRKVQVVPVPETAGERETLQRVALHAAAYLNTLMAPSTVLGLAWGNTLEAIAGSLSPRPLHGVEVVQLNGSANGMDIVNTFGESIVARFAQNYGGRAHSFPVPAFFDYAETRQALWRERSVKAIRALQERASVLVFSIGVAETGSHVYAGGYLDKSDLKGLRREGVVGDIATVFFRGDGRWRDVTLNARSSGPDLDRFRRARHALCVVSGKGKLEALRAALRGGFMNELVVDEPTARLLAQDGQPAAGRRTGASR